MEALMFYDIVNNLCKERKTTITRMAEDIGLSNAAPTSWRKGSVPKLSTLEKIADYFDVSVDYLRGVETKKAPTPKGEREYSDLDLIEAVMRADEQTKEVIRLILERK
jgi:transcriptional regulator with XRE-family HTH domain